MTAPFEVIDKVFVVTGGANGIGAEVVKLCLEEKAKFVAILDINEEQGKVATSKLKESYGDKRFKFIKCNVTDDTDLDAAFQSVLKSQGYIDVVVNSAGIMNDNRKVYKKEIDLNVTALITSTLKAFDLMRKDQGGRGGTVLNFSSVLGLVQHPVVPIYCATKTAVLQFSNIVGMDRHYSRTGIRVITLCFGKTTTGLIEKIESFDEPTNNEVIELIENFGSQRVEAAAKGVIHAYKYGESGSTWVVAENKPPKDVSSTIKEAFALFDKAMAE